MMFGEVQDDQQDHREEGHAQAELFANKVGKRPLPVTAPMRGAHFLRDDQGDGDGEQRPERQITPAGAGL